MRLSKNFTRTIKENPRDEQSVNAQLLERAGFVYKNSAGVYSYLPLGWRVLKKLSTIIREEMYAIEGQEMLMAALHDKHYLTATGRWDVDVVFKVVEGDKKEPAFNISWTHEEVITEIATKYVSSYKDLPFSAYQIQTKFRNEPRAKSGLLRGREFLMKDMYSFHTTEEDLFAYYARVGQAYKNVFRRCGLKAYYTLASGGEFTLSNTHEFQVVCPVGEDTIMACSACDYAENIEVSKLKVGDACPQCGGQVTSETSIEVGNIFPLGTKYSQAFNLNFRDENGAQVPVVMGSYGIGLGRVMGTVVEMSHDDNGIIWPEALAPYRIYLVALDGGFEEADRLYALLTEKGIEVLFDDRQDCSAGQKFNDADLIGIPLRIVVSKKTLEQNEVELKERGSKELRRLSLTNVMDELG